MRIDFEPEGFQPPAWGLVLLQCLVALFFCVFVFRFWYLQILRGEVFYQRAQGNRNKESAIPATRGLILDHSGALLAENSPAYGIALVREDCSDIPATLAAVSSWTGIPLASIQARYDQDRANVKSFDPQLLVPDISFEQLARIEGEIPLWPGISIVTRQRRFYPQGHLFAHILGYVAEANQGEIDASKAMFELEGFLYDNDLGGVDHDDVKPPLALGDTVGKQGLELVYEKQLRGRKGLYALEVDAHKRQVKKSQQEAPFGGENLILSLDLEMQKAASDALGEEAGSVVVMEPDTGKVRALVTKPGYDNNAFTGRISQKDWEALEKNPRHPMHNRTIQSAYPPGSVWKLMMAGLILNEGISPAETVFCPGFVQLGSQTFRCWSANGHGYVNLKQSLVHSCDVYYYTMGERLGIDRIEKFAKACGFGWRTGIDLPYERTGLVPGREWKKRRKQTWQRGETLNVSIGQGATLVTPVQMAVFVSGLMNGGKLLKPSLVDTEDLSVRGLLPMSDRIRDVIVEGMRHTVEDPGGTAKRLARPDAVMGGKTGTAQVVKMGEARVKSSQLSYEHRDHAWMVSWGIKGEKKYVVVVMVEHGGGGSSAAGPVCKAVYDYLFGSPASQNAPSGASAAPVQADSPQADAAAESIIRAAENWMQSNDRKQ